MILKTKDFILKYLSKIKVLPGTFNVKGLQTKSISKQIRPGDILLKGYSRYLDTFFRAGKYHHGGIYIGAGFVAHTTEDGVEIISLIDFCRCDRVIISRIIKSEDSKDFCERAIRRAFQFVETTENYVCIFNGMNHRLYSLDLIAMCYKEFVFSRTNSKLTDVDILKNSNFKVIYGNEVSPL